MNGKIILGVILLGLGISLFVLDFIRLGSVILYILALLAFVSPILSGKKIAAYIHDSHLARQKKLNANPWSFIYLWLFLWLFFLLIYTLATLFLSESIKFLISSIKVDYIGFVYNLLFFFGSFYLFKGKYEKSDNFLTMWGKMLEKGRKMGKGFVEDTMDRAKSFEKYL